MTKKYKYYIVLVLLLALGEGISLFLTTPYGLGQSPDSVGYLKSAIGLFEGKGFDYFNPQWPPIYPMLISLISFLFGLTVIDGARLLASLTVSATCVVICWPIKKEVTQYLFIVMATVVYIHPVMTHIYFYAWSEPLFILLTIVNLKLLSKLLKINDKENIKVTISKIVILAIISALSMLTRYVGVVLIITNIFTLLFLIKTDTKFDRLRIVLAYLVIVSSILLIWFIYSYFKFNALTNRTFVYHPPTLAKIVAGLEFIGEWFIPIYLPTQLYLIIGIFIISLNIIIVCTGLIILVRLKKVSEEFLFALFNFFYIGFILFSIAFIDMATPLDNRILSPIFVSMVVIIQIWYSKQQIKILKLIAFLFFLTLLQYSVIELRPWILLNKYNGVELAGKQYQARKIIALIKGCEKVLETVSDKPWEFDLYVKGKVAWLPRRFDMMSGKSNTAYVGEIKTLSQKFEMIIVADLTSDYITEIDSIGSYRKIYSAEDGVVWQLISMDENVKCEK